MTTGVEPVRGPAGRRSGDRFNRAAGEPRAGIIASVRAPLGFYVLCLLIVEGMVTITLESGFEHDAKFSGILLEALLFIIVVFLFTHLVIFHSTNLTFGSEDYLRSLELKLSAADQLCRARSKTDSPDALAGGVEHPRPKRSRW